MGTESEYLTLREAQEALGVSNYTIWRMVKEGRLAVHKSELDRRKKLVRRSDVEAMRKIEPVRAVIKGEAGDVLGS